MYSGLIGLKKEMLKTDKSSDTRVLLGCTQSPFLLGATVLKYLEEQEEEYKEEVAETKKSIYVDDLQLTGNKFSICC